MYQREDRIGVPSRHQMETARTIVVTWPRFGGAGTKVALGESKNSSTSMAVWTVEAPYVKTACIMELS